MLKWLAIGLMAILPVTAFEVRAEALPMSDSDLEEVEAMGEIYVGSYFWNDNHQYDSSVNKGALTMDGNAMQYSSGQSIVNATQSAISTGVTVFNGDVAAGDGSMISVTNNNEATAFIGGF